MSAAKASKVAKSRARSARPSAKGEAESDPLERYRAKRDFTRTPEPPGTRGKKSTALAFVIQKHHATRLHYDFRLEVDGVMRSWAVPKGPSYDPKVKRMAVQVEDHPISYNSFEGTIPAGQYGAGRVIIWDRGTWQPAADPRKGLAEGKLAFTLDGEKMQGAWELIRTGKPGSGGKQQWLLFKKHDAFERTESAFDVVAALPDSVVGKPSPRKPAAKKAAGVTKVTHPERVIDESTHATKLDLVRYYESVAEFMVPHLKGRPCSLVRAPSGISGQIFFQKHLDKLRIPEVKELDAALWPKHASLLEVPTETAIASAAQMNVIEFHTWNSRTRNIDKPDRVIFDVDPGEGVEWKAILEGTALARSLLQELGLESWLKTSGGKGLHIVVPLVPRHDWQTVRDFAQTVVQQLAQVIPDRFVAKSGASNRVGKIFVDYLRNTHGATTAAAFSARARQGLGVSMPVSWDQLQSLKSGAQWTIANAREHLSFQKTDPWADYWSGSQTLTAGMKALGLKSSRR